MTRRVLAVAAVVGLTGLTGCGPTPSTEGAGTNLEVGSYTNVDRSEEAPVLGGVLRYGLPAETNSWNPGLAQWGAHSMQVARAMFDPLFEYDDTGNVHPFLLEKAEHSADYTEWTMTLRDNIRFHDGRKMTATDVSRVAQQLIASNVVGSAWAINDLVGAEVLNDRALRVRSAKPWVTLPHQSASQLGFVPDPNWMSSADWGHPVGSGPFKVDHWEPGDSIVLKKNPDYWRTDRLGNRLPYLDRVEFVVIPDDAERFEELKRGWLDVLMQTAPGATAGELIKSARAGDIQLVTEDRGETPEDFVLLNTMRPQFQDVDTRRGLAAAIDPELASKELSGGVNPPAYGMYESRSPWYVSSNYPTFDPDRARNLLSRKGEPLTFVLKGAATPEGLAAMQFVRMQLEKVGVKVQVEAVQLSKMLITMMLGDFDALLLQHFDYPNPAPELVFVNPAQAKPIGQFTTSLSRIKDDGITRAIDGTLHSLDPADQKEAVALLQQRLGDVVPYVWLMHGRRHIAARPGVVNLVNHTLPDGAPGLDFLSGSHRIDQIWLRSQATGIGHEG